MLTTDVRRTNSVPLNVVIVCVVLFALRAALTAWNVFNTPPPLASSIQWQEQKQLAQKSKEVEGKPRLLFFYEHNMIPYEKLFESTVLANRAVVAEIAHDFAPYKMTYYTQGEDGTRQDAGSTTGKLVDRYTVTWPIEVVATLPDGYRIY